MNLEEQRKDDNTNNKNKKLRTSGLHEPATQTEIYRLLLVFFCNGLTCCKNSFNFSVLKELTYKVFTKSARKWKKHYKL